MGADRTLVAAAGKMAPAKVDYTMLFQGINAIGKLIATKTNIANELLAERPEGIDISELPEEMRAANMQYFEDSKIEYNNAVKAIKRSAPFTKKYRNAVATINKIKGGFEKNKKDLVSYAEWRTKVFTSHTTQSLQANASEKNFYADFVIDEGKMNAGVKFTHEGIKFGKDKIALADLPNIYSSSVGIKAGDMARSIILNYGKNIKLKNGTFSEQETRDSAENLVDTLHGDGGWKAVKSLAFDAKFNGRSFMQHVGDKLILSKDDQDGLYTNMSINDALKKYKKGNPTATENEINTMQNNMLADAWGIDQNDQLRNELVDFVVDRTRDKFNDTVYVSPNADQEKDNYFMSGYGYIPKVNVDPAVRLLNSNKDYGLSDGWDGSKHYRDGGVYYHMPKGGTEFTAMNKDQLAANLGIIGSDLPGEPNIYGYERAYVNKKKKTNQKTNQDLAFQVFDEDQYGDIKGKNNKKITGKITILSVNNDGTFNIRTQDKVTHKNIKLPNNMKPSLF
tara:strand:- start:4329 stop:5852 length:1524 start_codon:yes stop_codon:yes gene_type:complete